MHCTIICYIPYIPPGTYIMSRNTNLAYTMLERIHCGHAFCSFEVSTPSTSRKISDIIKRVKQLHSCCEPLFCSVTCHLRGVKPCLLDTSDPLIFKLTTAIKKFGLEVLLHLPAGNLSEKQMLQVLQQVQKCGINNIFALRGDDIIENTDFQYAVHLVHFIRKYYGKNIAICVAGYPVGHPESRSYEEDLKHLREKVDAGADFIITQIVFEANTFISFVQDCRKSGITVPIIPGILPIQDYSLLQHMSKLCHIEIPKAVLNILEPIKDNKESVVNFGMHQAVEMGKQILSSKSSSGLHFFTLNSECSVLEICQQLGFGLSNPMKSLQEYEDETDSGW